MVCGSNPGRYGYLAEELQNDFSKVNYNYPDDRTEAYNLIVNYKISFKPEEILVDYSEEVSFANFGSTKGKSNSYKSVRGGGERKVHCYWCGKIGHITREFPNQKEEEGDYAGKDKDQYGEININTEEKDSYEYVGD